MNTDKLPSAVSAGKNRKDHQLTLNLRVSCNQQERLGDVI